MKHTPKFMFSQFDKPSVQKSEKSSIIRENNKKTTVWLDCDPGLDDTFAIILSGRTKQINFIGVSTSAGNSTLNNTTKNALDVLHNIGRNDVPVVRGSQKLIFSKQTYAEHVHGEGGLGGVKIPMSPNKPIT